MAGPGQPRTGGRKPGSLNKKTKEIIAGAAAGGLMPLEYMLKVMRNRKADAHRRDDMAKSAAPYLHAKVTADGGMHMNIKGLNGSGQPDAQVSGIRVEFVAPRHAENE